MPQAAITGLAHFFLAVFGGTSAAATAAAFISAKVFVYAASTYLLNRASQALVPKPRSAGLGTGAEVNYADTGASVRICYGQVKTGGMETIPPTTSTRLTSNSNEDLHKVLTIAGHEIDSYNFTHFDTTTIVNAQIGAMAFTQSDGMVSSGPFGQHAFIRRYRGTSTDSADRILIGVNSAFFGNARARGIAKAALTFRYNADIYKSVPGITFTFQGKRCYDPRLDASPGAAPTNPSFIAWTRNPALCLADYLMSDLGGSYSSTDIDWDTVVTAANYCDGSVNIPGPSTQARYTCNGVLFATEEFTANVKALVDSMLGRIIFRDGKWRMYAGSWQTPTFTITKQDWISGLSIRFEQGKKKRFNQMRTWYIDSAREWQRMESLPRTNLTYRTADGGELIDAETEQFLCTNEFEAQRKGEFLLRQSRNQITVVGRLPPRFHDIALWDTGTIVFDHLGWASKTFRAVGIDMNPDGSMDCVFAEEQSSDWTDLDAADYNQLSDSQLPAANDTNPTEPPAFSATPQINGTILFDWTRPIVQPQGTEFQIIRSTNSSDASVGTVVWQGVAAPVPLVMPVSLHWYYARAVSPNSQFSAYTPNTFGLPAIPRLEADSTRQFRLVPDQEFTFGHAASLWTFDFTDAATYSSSGGFYGGYIRLIPSSASGGGNEIMVRAFMPPSGSPQYSARPFAVRFAARLRVNSFPQGGGIADEICNVGVVLRYRTFSFANSTEAGGLVARISISSAQVPALSQWFDVEGTRVVNGPSGASTYWDVRYYASLGATGSLGNYDFTYFRADDIGYHTSPIDSISTQLGHTPRWRDTMRQIIMSPTSGDVRPLDYNGSDFTALPIGVKHYVQKPTTNSAVTIIPGSGMTLRLVGRAAVGTITLVQSLPAAAIITKVNSNEALVDGVGMI